MAEVSRPSMREGPNPMAGLQGQGSSSPICAMRFGDCFLRKGQACASDGSKHKEQQPGKAQACLQRLQGPEYKGRAQNQCVPGPTWQEEGQSHPSCQADQACMRQGRISFFLSFSLYLFLVCMHDMYTHGEMTAAVNQLTYSFTISPHVLCAGVCVCVCENRTLNLLSTNGQTPNPPEVPSEILRESSKGVKICDIPPGSSSHAAGRTGARKSPHCLPSVAWCVHRPQGQEVEAWAGVPDADIALSIEVLKYRVGLKHVRQQAASLTHIHKQELFWSPDLSSVGYYIRPLGV